MLPLIVSHTPDLQLMQLFMMAHLQDRLESEIQDLKAAHYQLGDPQVSRKQSR